MNKKYLIFFIVLVSFITVAQLLKRPVDKIYTITFTNGVVLRAEVADTPQKLRDGLMFRTELKEDNGMLFEYAEEGTRSFWMKNTLIPLDIIWINENLEIVHILKNVAPCESDPCPTYAPKVLAKYVIEAPGNWTETKNIEEGMKITIDPTDGVPR